MRLRHLLWAVVGTLLWGLAAYGAVIKGGSLQASSDGVNVTVRWITEDESNVGHFEIERRSGTDGAFVSIGSLDPKGPGLYEFVDISAFRKTESIYQYRVKVVFSNGSWVYSDPVSIAHTVSGVRRTWGSIKAMFR